jgi:hypothetical protein
MRAIVTDEQRRNRPKVGLPEGPGRFRSGDCVVRRSHSPRYAPSSRLVGAPKSPRPNRVLFTQASIVYREWGRERLARFSSRGKTERNAGSLRRMLGGVGHLSGPNNFGSGTAKPGGGFLYFLELPPVQPNPMARQTSIQENPMGGREMDFLQLFFAMGTGKPRHFSFRPSRLRIGEIVRQFGHERYFFFFKPQAPASHTELQAHVVEDHRAEFLKAFGTVHGASWVRRFQYRPSSNLRQGI